jgi:hypothetical protein
LVCVSGIVFERLGDLSDAASASPSGRGFLALDVNRSEARDIDFARGVDTGGASKNQGASLCSG